MLKRFMTWLFNKIQHVLGAFTSKRQADDPTSSTNLGNEIASRLRQSSGKNEEAPVAVRDHNALANRQSPIPHSLPTQPASTQSTAPLRHKSSSVLKDTVDPVAKEADTHRRLDAAPASKPGGAPAVPSFPTDVSDLIPASSSLKESSSSEDIPISSNAIPSDQVPVSNQVPVPNIEAPAAEQLPEIHDLLPAIEPDEPNENITAPIIGQTKEELADNEQQSTDIDFTSSLVDAAAADTIAQDNQAASSLIAPAPATSFPPVVEDIPPASRGVVEVPTQGLSIADAEPEYSVQPINDALPKVPTVEDSTAGNLTVEGFTSEDLTPERSTDDDDEQATLFSFDIIENDSNAVNTEENPWLAAQRFIAVREAEPLLTKSGTVKLLFKLKPGNFHGYIEPEDGSKDILFHQKYINAEIFDDLERGARVVATVKQIEGKIYATHVDLLQEDVL